VIPRLQEAERLIMDLKARMAALEQKVMELGQSTGKLWGVSQGGGGGGGGGAFVAITPAIGAGGFATVDVSQLIAGNFVTVYPGATIYNPYLSSTTAGRIVTLCQNPDQSFTIYGQSCT
jgi:hypothetical protein